jgi:hypothetical protein
MMHCDPDRAAAAKACREILEIVRRDPDLRLSLSAALSARGYSSIYELANFEPDNVITMAAEFTSLEEQSP